MPAAAATVAATLVPAGLLGPPEAGPGSPAASAADPVASPVASPDASALPIGAPVLDVDLPFDERTQAALQAVLDRARARIPTPGISVAIRTRDGRVWQGVSGDRQLSPRRPVDTDTVFSIASITKTFVTATIMQLVAEGRLGLDDRLSRYLPDFPRAKRITIRQLLAHTSGVFNYFESAAYQRAAYRDPSRRWTTRQILRFTGPAYCDPGDCFHYSNTNFVLLGEVIREVTGRPVATVIRERFLDPLGLAHTGYQPQDATPRDAAHGHLWGGGDRFYDWTGSSRQVPTMSVATLASSAGAMFANAGDLARWVMALYGSTDVVDAALLDEMLTFRKRDEYGLGTRTRIFDGRRAVGHGGSLRGYEDQAWYFPDEGVSIVLLSNRGLYLPDRTVRQLARTLWRHIDVPEPRYDPDRNTR